MLTGPGLLAIRSLRLQPLARICFAIVLSMLAIYVAESIIFLCHLPIWSHYIVVSFGTAAFFVAFREVQRLWHWALRTSLWKIPAIFGLWILIMGIIMRNYFGGNWSHDWFSHYLTSKFFLYNLPIDAPGLMLAIPGRPPLINMLNCCFLGVIGDTFAIFQAISFAYSFILLLPLILIARYFHGSWHALIVMLSVIALQPMAISNCLYTWTRVPSTFILLVAVWAYLRARSAADRKYWYISWICFGVAMLAHYSAGPYALVLGALALWEFRYGKCWLFARDILAAPIISGTILATWIVMSIYIFGATATVTDNSSIQLAKRYTPQENILKVLLNIRDTLIPPHFDPFLWVRITDQGLGLGRIRDAFFTLYQHNLIFAFGILGGPLLIWLLICAWRRQAKDRQFWLVFAFTVSLLGIAVVGERGILGKAHLCLQPLILMGATWMACHYPDLGEIPRAVLRGGLLIDAFFGILIHVYILTIDLQTRVIPSGATICTGVEGLSYNTYRNGIIQNRYEVVMLGDLYPWLRWPMLTLVVVGIILFLWVLAKIPKADEFN